MSLGLQPLPESRLPSFPQAAAHAQFRVVPQHEHVIAVCVLPQLLHEVDVDDGRAVHAHEAWR